MMINDYFKYLKYICSYINVLLVQFCLTLKSQLLSLIHLLYVKHWTIMFALINMDDYWKVPKVLVSFYWILYCST